MPIYSYKCSNCEKVFDKFEKPGNCDKIACPECGSEALRIFSPVGIVFKGSGFYSTDYNSKSSKTAESGASDIKKDAVKTQGKKNQKLQTSSKNKPDNKKIQDN